MALRHALAGLGDQAGVAQQLGLRAEDAAFGLANARGGVLRQLQQLGAGGGQGFVQRVSAFGQRGRAVGHGDVGGAAHAQRANGQARAGADALQRRRPARRLPGAAAGRLRLGLAGFFGLGLFGGGQPVHHALQCCQGGGGIVALRGNVKGLPVGDAQLQQGHEVFGIARLLPVSHAHAGGKAPGRFHPLLGGARVQAVGIGHAPVKALRVVDGRGLGSGVSGGGRCCRQLQRAQDVARICRAGQLLQRGLVLQQARQAPQQRQVLVRLRGNGEDERGALPRVPLHAAGHLQHGDAGALNQVPVGNLSVRNGHAAAQIGIGRLLARQQALHIGRGDAAGGHQQLPRLPDGGGLVGGRGAQLNQFGADEGFGHGVFPECASESEVLLSGACDGRAV